MDDGDLASAVAYPRLTGEVDRGDRVLLNTTAVALGLGTGGVHFVMAVDGRMPPDEPGPGHIMKWRYTPWQRAALHAEEEGGPGHARLTDAGDLDGTPVVALGLHSHLAPVAWAVGTARPGTRIVYVHTDAGSLPVAFSDTVERLRSGGELSAVVSCGQAFGGDYEAVSLPSALLAARWVAAAEVVVCGMGPGVAGTGTRMGHSATEQAWIAQATAALGGRPLLVARLSAGDARARHYGLSHHTESVLGDLTLTPVLVPWPRAASLPRPPLAAALAAWRRSRASARHLRVDVDLDSYWEDLRRTASRWSTMGRGVEPDPLPFAASAAAGVLAAFLMAEDADRPGQVASHSRNSLTVPSK